MARTRYRVGYETEKRAREQLEGMGYFVVESRGSHGPVDLVAIPLARVAAATADVVRLVQVKKGTSIRSSERERLRTLARLLGSPRILVEVWCYPPWQSKPFIQEVPWENSRKDSDTSKREKRTRTGKTRTAQSAHSGDPT